MKTSSVFAACVVACTSFAWAGTSRDVAPEGVFKDGSVILFIGDFITHGGPELSVGSELIPCMLEP